MKIGIIGGTGFYDLFNNMYEQIIKTEYGEVTIFHTLYKGKDVYFLPRHGKHHNTLAPYVNYRANMMALKELGIERILAFSAVGAINPDINVGSLCLLDQFFDFTTRVRSYGEFSVDITEPFCSELKDVYIRAAEQIGEPLKKDTKLICVDGPRYETKAEVEVFSNWGMDVVGMTNATEASLSRELGMCYAVVTLATNMAPGISNQKLSLKAHKEVSESKKEIVKTLMIKAIDLVYSKDSCRCHEAYERAALARK
ncbi:MTAP family purine nucleoside phosphorylase [Neobacillus soli]|uniref:MTAP family purine nucleoside phosphorylase n=1 Tax=Neobacillus soli TaxID=220688 RepID=UPI0008262241|nr:MTAP family purine nucleoside phosphorylase [Neobacillus soli]